MEAMSYNADEILGIAIGIEKNATTFYQEAARFSEEESGHRKLFLNLGAMEQEHARLFTEMRQKLSSQERTVQPYDPGNEMLFYLKGMAGLHGWEGKAGPHTRLTGKEEPREVLTIAVNAERETVYFYNFLRDFVPARKGLREIDKIIREEMTHVARLNQSLSLLEESSGEPHAP